MKLVKVLLFAGAALLIIVGTAVGVVAINSRPDVGEFDRIAVKRIRFLCGKRTDCQVRLRDLSTLDWDELSEWNGGYTKADVERVSGRPFHPQRVFGRVVLLTKHGEVVYLSGGDEGIEGPIAGTVFFTCRSRSDTVTVCPADALMQVSSFHAEGDAARGIMWSGTSYVLHQIN